MFHIPATPKDDRQVPILPVRLPIHLQGRGGHGRGRQTSVRLIGLVLGIRAAPWHQLLREGRLGHSCDSEHCSRPTVAFTWLIAGL